MLTLVVMHGSNASYGVFLTQFVEQFKWSRAAVSGASSLAFFVMGFFATVGGRLTDRYGPRLTMLLCACFMGVGFLLVSQVNQLWQLYLAYGVVAAIGNSSGDIALLPTVARWFVRRRSLMSSMVKVGTGIGMFVIPILASWLILTYNWRVAYIVLAVLILLMVIGFSRLLKRDPSEMGLEPYGAANGHSGRAFDPGPNLALRETLRTWQFWTMCSAYFLVWYVTQAVMVHTAAHAIDIGLSMARAAGVVSIIGAASIVGRLTMGALGDRITVRRAVVVDFTILLAALIWLQFAGSSWMLYPFAVVYGFAHGGAFAVPSPLMAEMFGIKAHASTLGMLFFVGQVGGAIGPIITGQIFDVTHSYQIAFLILLIAAVAAVVLAAAVRPLRRPSQNSQ